MPIRNLFFAFCITSANLIFFEGYEILMSDLSSKLYRDQVFFSELALMIKTVQQKTCSSDNFGNVIVPMYA